MFVEVPVVDKKTGNATIEKVGVVEAWSWPSKEDAAEAKEAAERKSLDARDRRRHHRRVYRGYTRVPKGELRADVKAQTWAGKLVMPTVGSSTPRIRATEGPDGCLVQSCLSPPGTLVEIEDKDTNRHLHPQIPRTYPTKPEGGLTRLPKNKIQNRSGVSEMADALLSTRRCTCMTSDCGGGGARGADAPAPLRSGHTHFGENLRTDADRRKTPLACEI